MGTLCRNKKVQNSICKQTLPLPNSNLSSTDRKYGSRRRGQQSPTQRGQWRIEPKCPGFYSRIFLVHKKNGKLRLIIDLSSLNTFLDIQSFRMETANKVRQAIQPNDWAFSLDLTDAYLHVPIHRQSRKYLRFCLNDQTSIQDSSVWPCDKSLCFHPFDGCHSNISTEEGNCTVSISGRLVGQKSGSTGNSERPTVYNRVDYVLMSNNQRRKVRFGSVSEFCVHRNGIPNTQEHSSSAIRQSTGHFGTVTWFKKQKQVSARVFLSLREKLSAAAKFVVLGRLRPFQMAMFAQWKAHVLPLEYPILLNAPIRKHLEWWDNKGRFILGVTRKPSLPIQSFHGWEPLRKWSPSRTGRTADSWSLDSRPFSSSYQCLRDESNIASSKAMSPICLQFSSDDCHR